MPLLVLCALVVCATDSSALWERQGGSIHFLVAQSIQSAGRTGAAVRSGLGDKTAGFERGRVEREESVREVRGKDAQYLTRHDGWCMAQGEGAVRCPCAPSHGSGEGG